jgi:hypothetical protein
LVSKDGQDEGGSGPPPEIIEESRDICDQVIRFFVKFGSLYVSEVSEEEE